MTRRPAHTSRPARPLPPEIKAVLLDAARALAVRAAREDHMRETQGGQQGGQ